MIVVCNHMHPNSNETPISSSMEEIIGSDKVNACCNSTGRVNGYPGKSFNYTKKNNEKHLVFQ